MHKSNLALLQQFSREILKSIFKVNSKNKSLGVSHRFTKYRLLYSLKTKAILYAKFKVFYSL